MLKFQFYLVVSNKCINFASDLKNKVKFNNLKVTIMAKKELKHQPKYKDGDILATPSYFRGGNYVFIFKGYNNQNNLNYYVAVDNDSDKLYFSDGNAWCSKNDIVKYATEAEKQKLFKALAKNEKAWNAESKIIETQQNIK